MKIDGLNKKPEPGWRTAPINLCVSARLGLHTDQWTVGVRCASRPESDCLYHDEVDLLVWQDDGGGHSFVVNLSDGDDSLGSNTTARALPPGAELADDIKQEMEKEVQHKLQWEAKRARLSSGRSNS